MRAMRASFDVVVVGAGPAGSVAAREAARLGCGSVLLLDRAEFPRPKICAGGLSPRTCRLLAELGLWEEVSREAYPIRAVRLVGPNGRESVLVGKAEGAILPRRRLDKILVDAAVKSGVRFEAGVTADALLVETGRVVGINCGGGRISAGTVIVANGGNTRFNADPRPRLLVHTCMGWYEGVPFMSNVMELIYDRDLLPHYGWLFPESDTRVNVGVAASADRLAGRSIREVFASFIERRLAARLDGATQLGPWKGMLLSTTIDPQHHAPDGALIVGEANRLTNCATGEGILYAMQSGRIAAQAILAGKERGLDNAEVGQLYAEGLRRTLRRPFRRAHYYCKLGVRALNTVVILSKVPPVNRSLANLFSGL